jgi:hypothetical protein
MEIDSSLTYIVPRGTVVFRVETYSYANPPYLFYAYFAGNLKQQFRQYKRTWASRLNGNPQTRVVFMRTTRDLELLEMSMNNYNYDEPTTEELQGLERIVELARQRVTDRAELHCLIEALYQLYNASMETEQSGAAAADHCDAQVDYTVASFVYSHLRVDGWIRLAHDEGSVALDEVMLVRRVLDSALELVAEYGPALLEPDAAPPDFMDDHFVQPQIYRRLPISRRTRSHSVTNKKLLRQHGPTTLGISITQQQAHNDAVRLLAQQSDGACLECKLPCSVFEGGDPALPFCSKTCQARRVVK